VSTMPAYAAGFKVFGAQYAVPALFLNQFPSWFAGITFAAVGVGALVPAAIMSIAAANLFTRNVYREYIKPHCTEKEEANTARFASLVVKIGALAFILELDKTYAINLQLLGGIWILQTLPAIVIALYTRWFHRWGLLAGWAAGMISGTWMFCAQNFTPVYPLRAGARTFPMYEAVIALAINLAAAGLVTLLARSLKVPEGVDQTSPGDYQEPR
jgi:solute:Na+ symporter, SSS family